MPTIIARRIKAELAKSRGANAIRASNLIQYITQAEDDEGAAKCTAIRTIGFADTNLTQEEIICQLKDDMDLARLKKHELLTHWVVSWKGEERPGHDEVFQAANELMAKLGYTDSHKQVFTIHENTEHIHIHIAACKVDMWSGKILREGNGWYKNASQKALVGIAEKHGWELEPGHHFTRPKRTKRPKLHDRAMAKEKHTGEAAEQTKLRDLLQQFVEEHEEDFPRWKFAHLHENLARLGIECVRVEIKPDVFGIRFSLDSKIFCKAGTVCPSLTYKNLMEKIGAKSWRNARPEIREILEESRKRFNTSVQPHRPRVLKRLGKRQKRQFPPTPQIGITSEGVIVEHSQEVVGTDSLGQNVRPDPKFLGISSDGEPAAKTLSMGICSNGEFIPLQTAPKGLRSDGQVVQAASTGICSDGHTARNEENNEREQDSRSEPNRGHMESDKRRKRAKL